MKNAAKFTQRWPKSFVFSSRILSLQFKMISMYFFSHLTLNHRYSGNNSLRSLARGNDLVIFFADIWLSYHYRRNSCKEHFAFYQFLVQVVLKLCVLKIPS